MSFKEMWDKAGEDADEYEPNPGGHKVVIVGGSAFTSRAGDDYCKVELQELEGENAGRRFEHFMGFKHETGARINREALLSYGLKAPEEITDIIDLDAAIKALEGTQADVTVRYKDGYMNISVSGSRPPAQQQIPDIPNDPEPKPAASFASAAGSDDSVPF
jgi:hypothetical protein